MPAEDTTAKDSSREEQRRPVVLAIAAHPDDVEFMMAGTLILLGQRGCDLHVIHLCDGRCGTSSEGVEEIVATRTAEARAAARLIDAHYHPSIARDLQLYHTTENVAKVVAVIRAVHPSILLLHSPFDYMEDHVNSARIAVTAAFARGMINFPCDPPLDAIQGDVSVYHALPYGLRDPLRRTVRAGLYVDVSSVMDRKREMLSAHASQSRWLSESQGVSYLETMSAFAREVGRMSGKFDRAEGWTRRNHLGLASGDKDPLNALLGPLCIVDPDIEREVR